MSGGASDSPASKPLAIPGIDPLERLGESFVFSGDGYVVQASVRAGERNSAAAVSLYSYVGGLSVYNVHQAQENTIRGRAAMRRSSLAVMLVRPTIQPGGRWQVAEAHLRIDTAVTDLTALSAGVIAVNRHLAAHERMVTLCGELPKTAGADCSIVRVLADRQEVTDTAAALGTYIGLPEADAEAFRRVTGHVVSRLDSTQHPATKPG